MATTDNLTPWPKGTSGNPAGAKPGKSITTILAEWGEKKMKAIPDAIKQLVDDGELTYNEAIALQLLRKGTGNGNLRAIKEIMDRTEGKSIQRTQLSGPDGGAVPVKFVGIEVLPPKE